MNDVARLAGVSQSTVSLVVNNRDAEIGISEDTRARVLAVIAKLGYRPNLAARGLRLQRSRTFGFITDQIASSPFAGRTVLGAQDAAWKADHLLLTVNTYADRAIQQSAVEALIDRGVDGLLYAPVSWCAVDLPAIFGVLPCVLVNCWSAGGQQLPAVVPCETDGGRLAAEELLARGHRRIAFLGGTPADAATVERELGFHQALAAAGIPAEQTWIRHGDYQMSSGYRLARELYAAPAKDRPTGLVCGNDRMAAGAISGVKDCGLSVPGDVSVVGYDDQEGLADEFTPTLTTVSIPHYEMGRAGVEQLLARLAAGGDTSRLSSRTPIAGRLIRRNSVGAPPAASQFDHSS